MRSSYGTIKRSADVILAGVLLVIAAPVIAFLCLLVHLSLGRPVFFLQQRAGLLGKPFTIIKLRTMSQVPADVTTVRSESERIGALGRCLRRSGLDELPQLWNVLIGDMSVVGPRPLLTSYLDRYSDEQRRRHEVRPGITGWAQVNGRNSLDWSEYFKKDLWYVDNMSATLDAYILLRSLFLVVSAPFGGHRSNMVLRAEFKGLPGVVGDGDEGRGEAPTPALDP